MARGTVRWFDQESGYGYITPDAGGQDIYLHRVSLVRDLRLTLATGDKLEFETRVGRDGLEAVNVVAPATRRVLPQQIVATARR